MYQALTGAWLVLSTPTNVFLMGELPQISSMYCGLIRAQRYLFFVRHFGFVGENEFYELS